MAPKIARARRFSPPLVVGFSDEVQKTKHSMINVI
jgi:hypothetical protein